MWRRHYDLIDSKQSFIMDILNTIGIGMHQNDTATWKLSPKGKPLGRGRPVNITKARY